jgi:hypothetical protein
MAAASRSKTATKPKASSADDPSSYTFTACVEPVSRGVPFYVVEIPATVSRAFGKGRIHVVATVKGIEVQTSLNPKRGGRHQMFLNRQVRQAASIASGERVKVALTRAAAPREEVVPADVVRGLRDADAIDAFQRIARSTRNALVLWVEDAKTEATREKRVERIVERALEAREKEIDRQASRLTGEREA